MMAKKMSCLAVLLIGLTACASLKSNTASRADATQLPTYQHKVIALENLTTRVIAYCYATPEFSAEQCAAELETQGYVRLNDIPRFTAKDSTLEGGTYPTRRWRENNRVPRW